MSEVETKITFNALPNMPISSPREVLRIVPTEGGFDIVIPDDVTPTEAASQFIKIVMELLAKRTP